MKVCEKCETEIFTGDGDNKCPACERAAGENKKKKEKKKFDVAAKRALMTSLGLTRVRGALGGIYYE